MNNITAYEPQQETLNLERAAKAVSYMEQLEHIITSIQGISELVSAEYSGELKAIATRASALYQALDNTEEGASLIDNGNKLSGVSLSKIERLKMGSEIIRLRNNGKNYKETGDYLGISPQKVSQFCKAYDAAPPSKKAELKKSSIFDIASNMEDLGAMIYRQLARLENTDPEHHVKYTGELRQLLVAAQKFMESHSAQRKIDSIGMLVSEILMDELPEKRAKVLARFREIGFRSALPVA